MRAPLAVGAFDWQDPDTIATVVVKVTYSFAGEALAIAADQRPLSAENVASLEPDLWGEVYYPLDFVPHKPAADVIVVGHAHSTRGPAAEIPVRITVGAMDRSALARAAAPAEKIPLNASCLFAPDGQEPRRVGPARLPAARGMRSLASDFDYHAFNAAPPEQRRAYLAPGEPVRLEGLSPRGDRAFDLPREVPRVRLSLYGVPADPELQIVADTLWIDSDQEIAVIVYRGMLVTPRLDRVSRIAVSLEEVGSARPWPVILRSAARGSVLMSAAPDHPDAAARDDEERDRLTAARAEMILGEVPPEPLLSLDEYARIGAELAEQREPRSEVLARHGLDETTWMAEERGWLEQMAREAQEGDGTLAADYGEKYAAAQDALGTPEEARRTHADWADITAALEASGDIARELKRRELTLAAWMRLDRRVQRAAEDDDAVAEELERLLDEARARIEAAGVSDEEPDTERPAALAGADPALRAALDQAGGGEA